MAVQLGIYYFDPDTYFPAVVIKTVSPGFVLIRIWAEGGDQTHVAPTATDPGVGVFVMDG
jgi:hypothetical protein